MKPNKHETTKHRFLPLLLGRNWGEGEKEVRRRDITLSVLLYD